MRRRLQEGQPDRRRRRAVEVAGRRGGAELHPVDDDRPHRGALRPRALPALPGSRLRRRLPGGGPLHN